MSEMRDLSLKFTFREELLFISCIWKRKRRMEVICMLSVYSGPFYINFLISRALSTEFINFQAVSGCCDWAACNFYNYCSCAIISGVNTNFLCREDVIYSILFMLFQKWLESNSYVRYLKFACLSVQHAIYVVIL